MFVSLAHRLLDRVCPTWRIAWLNTQDENRTRGADPNIDCLIEVVHGSADSSMESQEYIRFHKDALLIVYKSWRWVPHIFHNAFLELMKYKPNKIQWQIYKDAACEQLKNGFPIDNLTELFVCEIKRQSVDKRLEELAQSLLCQETYNCNMETRPQGRYFDYSHIPQFAFWRVNLLSDDSFQKLASGELFEEKERTETFQRVDLPYVGLAFLARVMNSAA